MWLHTPQLLTAYSKTLRKYITAVQNCFKSSSQSLKIHMGLETVCQMNTVLK